jgi:flagellar biosynthesis/type III secretory pathway protein FliH
VILSIDHVPSYSNRKLAAFLEEHFTFVADLNADTTIDQLELILNTITNDVYEDAYEEGRNVGYDDGYEEGLTEAEDTK